MTDRKIADELDCIMNLMVEAHERLLTVTRETKDRSHRDLVNDQYYLTNRVQVIRDNFVKEHHLG